VFKTRSKKPMRDSPTKTMRVQKNRRKKVIVLSN